MTNLESQPTFTVEIAGRKLEFQPVDESPCRRACPAGIDVKKYVGQIAGGDFTGALATIRKHMPFPSACGRICLHPCETECKRGAVDEPIAIMHLKRFVADYEARKGSQEAGLKVQSPSGMKVAIVGSGPSGLTAAHDLALMGHSVTVIERSDKPGGNLANTIPEFELPSSAVHHDIERIEALGVTIKCGHSIQGYTGLQGLLNEGHDAVLIATGTSGRWSGLTGKGWIEGIDSSKVIGAVEFLQKYRGNNIENAGESLGKVALLGFGVQALASARYAVRLGCPEVTWILPVKKDQLQPEPRRIKLAEDEGVRILELTRPIAIDNDGVRVVELTVEKTDHTGRPVYSVKDGTEQTLAFDTIIDAAHFAPDMEWENLSKRPWQTILVHPDTMATEVPGVFASGDVVSGPKSVVEAVSLGHRAAAGIHRFLTGEKSEIGTLSELISIKGWEFEDPAGTPTEAYKPLTRPADLRIKDFQEAEQAFTSWQATREAQRCLLCGPCSECAVCLSNCYRKRGVFIDADGNPVEIRVPLGIARGLQGEKGTQDIDNMELLAAVVDLERCRGCGVCEDICGYHAPRIAPDQKYGLVSSIDLLACKGCGTCITACPSGAIDQGVTSLHAIYNGIWGDDK